MINLLHWIWCLPQMLAALILRLFVKVSTKENFNNCIVYKCNLKGGSVSLGNKLFLGKCHWSDHYTRCHEYGHYKQGLILGPLYLIVIGVPSLVWCWVLHPLINKFKKVSYYSFYTEKWANKLGGLE